MRPLSPARLLAATLLLISPAHPVAAKPVDATVAAVAEVAVTEAARHNEERGLLDILGGIGGGNLTQDINNVIADASALLQSFMAVIQDLKNATNENDLVDLLGLSVKGAKNDDQKVTSNTVGAVGANATCPGMAVLFARGTAEPGNVGLYTGPSFFTALRNYINGSTTLAVQGVPYPASIPGFLVGGSPYGSAVMAALVNKTAAACPNTKIVLSGYSQGCQVVHNAMSLINAPAPAATTPATTANDTAPEATPSSTSSSTVLSSSSSSSSSTTATTPNAIGARQATTTTTSSSSSTATAAPPPAAAAAAPLAQPRAVSAAQINAQVMSVVLFGDPRNGTAVPGADAARVLSVCNAQDDICARGGDVVTLDHLTYNRDAPRAAMFVMQRSGLGVASADAVNQGMGNVPAVPAQKGVSGSMQLGSGPGLPGMAAFLRGGLGGLGG